MGEFKIDMTVDEILEKMNNSKANTEIMHAGPCFLQYKLQQQLLQDQEQKHRETLDAQNEYNKKINLDSLSCHRRLAFSWSNSVFKIKFLISQ